MTAGETTEPTVSIDQLQAWLKLSRSQTYALLAAVGVKPSGRAVQLPNLIRALAAVHRAPGRPKRALQGVRCSACLGACRWVETAWVCTRCGSEWFPDHGEQFQPPS